MPSKPPTARTTPQARSTDADYRKRPDRAEDNRFYCSSRWKKLRLAFLRRNPLCADFEHCHSAASEVHHIKERKDFPSLAFEWSNLQALCRPCHNRRRRASDLYLAAVIEIMDASIDDDPPGEGG